MNNEWIVFNLKEGQEELEKTIQKIEQDPNYDIGEYLVAMTHLYHHINTAWNSKDANSDRIETCSSEDFNKWRQFPKDIDMST